MAALDGTGKAAGGHGGRQPAALAAKAVAAPTSANQSTGAGDGAIIAKTLHKEGVETYRRSPEVAAPFVAVPASQRFLRRSLLRVNRRLRPDDLRSPSCFPLPLAMASDGSLRTPRGVIGCGRRRRTKVAIFSLPISSVPKNQILISIFTIRSLKFQFRFNYHTSRIDPYLINPP